MARRRKQNFTSISPMAGFRRAAPAPSVTIVEAVPAGARRARSRRRPSLFRRSVRSVRSGFKGVGQASYAAVTSDYGIQAGCELAEVAAALAKGGLDMYASQTASTADDMAMPWVQKGIATGARVLAAKVIARKHPGLAAVVSAFGSGLSATVWHGALVKWGIRAQERVQSPRNP